MLVAVVIDAEWFDAAFDQIVSTNAEGEVVASDSAGVVGVPFTEERIKRLLSESPMQSAGAALLQLAWARRDVLLPSTRGSQGASALGGQQATSRRSRARAPRPTSSGSSQHEALGRRSHRCLRHRGGQGGSPSVREPVVAVPIEASLGCVEHLGGAHDGQTIDTIGSLARWPAGPWPAAGK